MTRRGPSVPIQKFLSSSSVDVEGAAAEALDGRQDVVGRLGPAERLRACVLLTDERLDDLGTLRIGARDLALNLILLAFRPISPESLIRSIELCRARVARKFRNGTLAPSGLWQLRLR